MTSDVKVPGGNQNAAKYIELMKTNCVPIMTSNMKPKIHMVQDNCSIHVAKIAKDYFKTQNFNLIE